MAFKPYCVGDVAAVKSPPFSRWKRSAVKAQCVAMSCQKIVPPSWSLCTSTKKQIAHARAANGAHNPHIDNLTGAKNPPLWLVCCAFLWYTIK